MTIHTAERLFSQVPSGNGSARTARGILPGQERSNNVPADPPTFWAKGTGTRQGPETGTRSCSSHGRECARGEHRPEDSFPDPSLPTTAMQSRV
jgi:hypothetical protein